MSENASEKEAPVRKILRVYAAIHAAGAASGRMKIDAKPSRSIAGQPVDKIRDVTFQITPKDGAPAEIFTLNELAALMHLVEDQTAQAQRANTPASQPPTFKTTVNLHPTDAAIQEALAHLRRRAAPSPFFG
ncbi:MAG: hypothetical protein JWN24_632 [Phycisphaerales bacterium]|nr:hypothetical protein [Phycisphaerales bacterium]